MTGYEQNIRKLFLFGYHNTILLRIYNNFYVMHKSILKRKSKNHTFFIMIPTLVLASVVLLSDNCYQIVAQVPDASNSTTNQGSKWSNLFNSTDYQQCNPLGCLSNIEVLYESPNTVVLNSDYVDVIWKAVDEVKKDGFKVDDFATYSITSMSGESNRVNVMVLLSK